jgi:hypothetical protein
VRGRCGDPSHFNGPTLLMNRHAPRHTRSLDDL